MLIYVTPMVVLLEILCCTVVFGIGVLNLVFSCYSFYAVV